MNRLHYSAGVTIATLLIMSFLAGLAVGYMFGPKIDAGASATSTLNIEFGNTVMTGAIFVVGFGMFGFLWTLSQSISELRERLARLEEKR